MAGRIPNTFIQDLIARTDIVELINSRVALQKRGKTYMARCPFHDEKSPSFSVSQDKQFYYCFGCGASGNAVGFLMAYDRMEFIDAIEYLANQLNVEIPREHSNSRNNNEQIKPLYQALEFANQYFQDQLRQAPQAIEYLKNRGISGKIAKYFQVGFAPEGWDNLLKQCQNNIKHCLNAGLLIEKDSNRHYDRFRNRVMFPIRDIRGRVVAFGGRTISDDNPKYLNSPETPVFHKSNELYGLYESRQANRNLKHVLMVEGYMDVVALFQHGLPYAVATLGTAINQQHIHKLLRYTDTIIFCFDGDQAGYNAAWKALTIALPILRDGTHFRFLFLPQGHDPDSLVTEHGKQQFEDFIQRKAQPLESVFFRKLQKDHPMNSIDGKAAFAKAAQEYLTKMPQGLYRNLMTERLAEIVNVKLSDLSDDTAMQLHQQPTKQQPKRKQTQMLTAIELVTAILLQHPVMINSIEKLPPLQPESFTEQKILMQVMQIVEKQPNISMGELLANWQDPESQTVIANLAARPLHINEDALASELNNALQRISQQQQQTQLSELIQQAKIRELDSAEKKLLQELLQTKT